MRSISLLLLAGSLALPCSGQSLLPFGKGCGPRRAVLAGYGSPTPGGVVEFDVSGTAPGAPHLLIAGISRTRWAGGQLPMPIPPGLGFGAGCALLVSPDAFVDFAAGRDGRATWRFRSCSPCSDGPSSCRWRPCRPVSHGS